MNNEDKRRRQDIDFETKNQLLLMEKSKELFIETNTGALKDEEWVLVDVPVSPDGPNKIAIIQQKEQATTNIVQNLKPATTTALLDQHCVTDLSKKNNSEDFNIKQVEEEINRMIFLQQSLPFKIVNDGVEDHPIIELEDKELWNKFHYFTNEMIITKSGRHFFPSLRVKISGLDPNAKYFIMMDLQPTDEQRYKFQNYKWEIAGKADPEVPKPMHVHPDSPNTGEFWMSKDINFCNVKMTNSNSNKKYQTVLNSMHKYVPRIHIVRAGDDMIQTMKAARWVTVIFSETEFIAVTAYQNEMVTQLKLDAKNNA